MQIIVRTVEKDCPVCEGEGEIAYNPSRIGDPQMETSAPCGECRKGVVEVEEAIEVCDQPGARGCQTCEACDEWGQQHFDARREDG